jgi:hypothetical protein
MRGSAVIFRLHQGRRHSKPMRVAAKRHDDRHSVDPINT